MTICAEPTVDCAVDDAARALSMQIEEDTWDEWPLIMSRHVCVARCSKGEAYIEGAGCGTSAVAARRRAVMECIERYSQFCCEPSRLFLASAKELGAAAVSPHAFGLYSPAQYRSTRFRCARYSEAQSRQWVEVTESGSRREAFVPVEFAYPHFVGSGRSLVAETSSGTAAHSVAAQARLAAFCELIERDALLLFWHRQPPTRICEEAFVSAEASHDLDALRRMGVVVILCDLTYDLGVPCALALAFRGNRVAYGCGCNPSMRHAIDHALTEMSALLRWQLKHRDVLRGELRGERWDLAQQQRELYDGGPLHDVLRRILDRSVFLAQASAPATSRCNEADERDLSLIASCLEAGGYHLYERDMTPPEFRSLSIAVIRAFVPGLIPLYFGPDCIRFGCERLVGRHAPGRLANLLPHFMS